MTLSIINIIYYTITLKIKISPAQRAGGRIARRSRATQIKTLQLIKNKRISSATRWRKNRAAQPRDPNHNNISSATRWRKNRAAQTRDPNNKNISSATRWRKNRAAQPRDPNNKNISSATRWRKNRAAQPRDPN